MSAIAGHDPFGCGRTAALYPVLVVLVACATLSCGPPSPFRAAAPPRGAFAWRTLQSEHATLVTARARDGRTVSRRIRGVIAVARPDRFRLRALGPGGVTLFDLLDLDGRCVVLSAAGDAAARPASGLGAVLDALCEDLRAAYRLDAPPPRPGRRILYGDWRNVGASWEPFRILIEDPRAGFTADITVLHTALDQPQDPALFDLPPPR